MQMVALIVSAESNDGRTLRLVNGDPRGQAAYQQAESRAVDA